MRKVLGSISLLVLLLNTLLAPLTYAWEYEEILEISGGNASEEVNVEEDGDNEMAPEFSVEEKNWEEESDWENIENSTWNVVEEWSWEVSEIGSWEIEDLTGESVVWDTWTIVENLTWLTGELTWFAWELTWEISKGTWTGEESVIEEINYNKEPILWEKTYNDVTVRVEALTWIFPEWTELRITPIKWWNLSNLKEKLVEEQEEIKEDTTVVAFDITFIYSWEEVQPKEWEKVKVTFDYSNNEEFVEADKDETQSVKLYHIEDKDEEWNELEKEEQKIIDVTNKVESWEEWIIVADWESFSIYAVVTVEWEQETVHVTYNLSWWYWVEDGSISPKYVTYVKTDWIYKPTEYYRTPSKTWFMFMWWFDQSLINRRNWVATEDIDVYAKWQEFWDLDVYILWTDTDKYHYTLMDRNMWATATWQAWYYYQWWNNFWFIAWSVDTTEIKGKVSGLTWATPYSYNLFVAKKDYQDWMETRNMTLRWWWNDTNLIHKQWPCPDWYHVPTENDWTDAKAKWILYKTYTRSNTEFANDFMFQWHWYISRNDWKYSETSDVRYLTSSTKNQGKWVRVLASLEWSVQDEWYANWRSLRCFKNGYSTSTTPINLSDIHLNWWEKAIITTVSWVVVSMQNPYKNLYRFIWWYTNKNFLWEPIVIWSTLNPWSSLYARWEQLDVYTITYDLQGWFMKLNADGVDTNPTEFTEESYSFTVNNPGKLNAVFIGWTWTNLTKPVTTLQIPKWSSGNRNYIALYKCEQGHSLNEDWECVWTRNADGTLNYNVWEYEDIDFDVWYTKISMMDRNLGASSNDITKSDSYWFYYKWWNNYGFSTNHTNKYGSTAVLVNDISWYGPNSVSWYFMNHDWIYIPNGPQRANWYSSYNYDLWWDSVNTEISRRWPCKEWYHIPSYTEAYIVVSLLNNDFMNTSSWVSCVNEYSSKRNCFQNLLKIPSAWYVNTSYSSSSSMASDVRDRSFIWTTSKYSDDDTLRALHSSKDGESTMVMWERWAANAIPVRCFKNLGEITVNYDFNGWYYYSDENIYNWPLKTWFWYNLKKSDVSPLWLKMKRDNSTFDWWYLDSEFTKLFTWETVYPYITQDTTFYAKFDCNAPYVPSVDGKSCIFNNNIVTYDYQSHSWVNGNTTIDVSYWTEITLPSEWITSQKWYNFIWWTTIRGWTEPISNVQTIVWDVTFYPIFKKDAIEKNMTFNLNWSERFTYSWTDYLANTTLHLCTIEERYNNQEDLTGCEAIIQLPPISWSDNTPEVSWWSTWLDMAAIPVWTNLKITADKDDIVNFYAQTYSLPKTYRLNYEYWTWVLSSVVTSWSCEIAWTINGVAQSWSCSILLPQLVLKQWFKDPLWYNLNHWYTWEVKVFWVWMDNGLNLEDGDVLTGIAHAKDDVKYVVKHYYQMLNADGTELLENQYKLGRVEEKAWLAHSIIELSWEKFDDLVWYTYYTWTIQATVDEVDISGISTATTWEINPEWTLVITLFYTRDTYRVDWIDQGNTIKTENNLPYWVKVNHYKPTDPTKATDEQYTYTFAWWYDEDDDLLTWDTLLTTWTVYTSKYNSETRTYTIIWENSTWTVLETDADVEYWSMPSYDWEEPTSWSNAQYTYYFSWWTPQTWMVVKDQVYTAVYNSSVNQYAITFVDEDGTVLKEAKEYDYDTSVVDIEKPADPTKTADAHYTYSFAWWNPWVHDVTWAQVYTATYSSTVNKYTVLWKNSTWTILETDENVEYWTKPKYDWNTPTSWETVEYQYWFSWWTPIITNETIIEWDTVYTATYEQIKRKYEITWEDYNDQVIDTTEVEYWVIPTHTNPTRTWHEFNTWDPIPVEVVWPTSYKAIYTIKQYTVTPEKWVWVADILWWWTYDYGTEIVLTGYAKEWYHFEWWATIKEFNVEVPDKNITVRITAQPNTYYVHFKNNGWEWVMGDQEFTYDQEQALISNAYTRNWFTFVSWTDWEWGIYKDKAVVKNLATSWTINLIAQWIEWDVPGPTPPSPTPSWWWGWKTIDDKTDDKQHDSAEDKQQEKEIKDDQTKKHQIIKTWEDIKQLTWDSSVIIPEPIYNWTEEELTAYKFAYKYWITTLAPEYAAMPDEYVVRWHMAKMVVNYALNVLHRKLPDKLPKQCKWKDWANAWESKEIKDYAEKACALWIMWIDMNYFQPNKYVTRAQFWTIIWRLLRWKLVSKPYYVWHLERLKQRWIMTQIENPENRIEIRKWAWLMFMRMEKYQ